MNERAVYSRRVEQESGRQIVASATTSGLPATQVAASRQVAIVLGMHRSGTSLLSNAMHYLGCDMADTSDAISDKNPGGFWERPQIVALHDEILEAIDRAIGTPQHLLPFPAGWWRRKEIKPIKQRLIEYVAESLAGTNDLWGFKDPRMCRMLPLWKEILRAVGAEPVYVHAIRAPEPAGRSMSLKNPKLRPLTDAQSELMWLVYNYDIVRYTAQQNVLVVDYDEWFRSPGDIAVRLVDHLGLPSDLSYDEARNLVGALVSSDFRNQHDDPASAKPTIARSLFEAMRESARDSSSRSVEQQLPFIELMFRSIEPLIEQLREIPELQSAVARGEEAARDLDVRMRQVVDLKRERNDAEGIAQKAVAEKAITEKAAVEAAIREDQLRQRVETLEEALAKAAAAYELAEGRLTQHDADEALQHALADQLAGQKKVFSDRIERLSAETRNMAAERETAERAMREQFSAENRAQEEVFGKRIADLERAVSRARDNEDAARRACAEETARAAEIAAKLDSVMGVSVDQITTLFEQSLASVTELLALRDVAQHNRLLENEVHTLRALVENRVPRVQLERTRQRSKRLLKALRDARVLLESLAALKTREAEAREGLASVRSELEMARRRLAWQGNVSAAREKQFADLQDDAAILRVEKLALESRLAADLPRAPALAVPVADTVAEARFALGDEGVSGYVRLTDQPDVPLIVEALVDGLVVASVLTRPAGDAPSPDRAFALPAGHVTIPWDSLPGTVSGRLLSLRLAGSMQPLGDGMFIPDLTVSRTRPESAVDDAYQDWLRRYWAFGPAEREAARAFLGTAGDWPLVSVILLRGQSNSAAVVRSIDSVCAQIYENWELLVASDILDGENRDPRIREVADKKLADLAAAADGKFICFLGEGDLLAEDALLTLAAAADAARAGTIFYADEDRFDPATAKRSNPHLKGAWSPDLFLRQDYIARPALIPSAMFAEHARGAADAIGVYSSLLGVTFGAAQGSIQHVPRILYHRSEDAHVDPNAACQVVEEVVHQMVPSAEVIAEPDDRRTVRWPLPEPAPLITLIVPTRDRLDLLRVCVEGILRDTEYPNIELLIVDNDSVEPETHAYLRAVARDGRVKVLRWSGAFDYSAINNFAADCASGSIIGLLNNDLRMERPDWLLELVRHAVRPDVGAVGARLLYADGTLQHAGIVMGIGIASHRYKAFPADHPGHCGLLLGAHDVTAVTAACILIRKDVWDQVGGLSLDFPVAYNDVDLCLRIGAAGYRIILEPRALLYHLESQSRGSDQEGAKRVRLMADRDLLVARWPDATRNDPFYNPNLTLKATDAGLAHPPRVSWPWEPAGNVAAS